MRKFVSTVCCLILALLLLLFDAVFAVVLILQRLWEKWLRTARELREGPPEGGMYGTMARRLREKAHSGKVRMSDKELDRRMRTEIEKLECAVIPDWRVWTGDGAADRNPPELFHEDGTPFSGAELMAKRLSAKLLRIGCGIRGLDPDGFIAVNIDEMPEFFRRVAELARFAGAGSILVKRSGQRTLTKLDLATRMETPYLGKDLFAMLDRRFAGDLKRERAAALEKPREAAIDALCTSRFSRCGIFGKMGIDAGARRFDMLYQNHNTTDGGKND